MNYTRDQIGTHIAAIAHRIYPDQPVSVLIGEWQDRLGAHAQIHRICPQPPMPADSLERPNSPEMDMLIRTLWQIEELWPHPVGALRPEE